jgi:nucleoside-diphosphate-sugar epimerase
MKLSIIGLGWFGLPLAERLQKEMKVVGSKRVAQPLIQGDIGIFPLNFTPEIETANAEELFQADTLVLNIPPSAMGTDYLKAMWDVVRHLKYYGTGKLIFISSTGVFGDHQLEVDEETLPEPTSNNGKILRDAEILFQSNHPNCILLRPGGLVGGQRHPAKFLSGRTGLKGQHHPVNLVHREDLIKMCIALIHLETGEKVFHAVSLEHPEKAAFYREITRRNDLALPVFDPSDDTVGKKISAEHSWKIISLKPIYASPYDMPLEEA